MLLLSSGSAVALAFVGSTFAGALASRGALGSSLGSILVLASKGALGSSLGSTALVLV